LLKFKKEKEALRLYLEKVRISIPLANGKKGYPFILPGASLKNYIEELL